MKRRKTIFLIGVIGCSAVVIVFGFLVRRALSPRAPLPVYQGQNAKQWLDQVFTTNQTAAFAAFRAMGTDAVPVLVRALSDSQWDRFYGTTYSNLPMVLRKHLSIPNSETTWSAAELMLINNTADSKSALPELAPLLLDKRNRARRSILFVIQGCASPEHKDFTPIFKECLKDTDPMIRREAAYALGRMGPEAKLAIPSLISALNDPMNDVRVNAAFALWKIDGKTDASFSAARKTLAAEALQNVSMAVVCLSEADPDYPGIVSMLVNVLKNDQRFRASAALSLRRYGARAKEAVPVLLEIIKQSNSGSSSREPFLQALKSIDPDDAANYEMEHPANLQ